MNETSRELRELQQKLTELALTVASAFKIKLDFSLDSIKKVENILSLIHNDYKKTKDEDGKKGIALEFAAYIVSVIEKNGMAGYWERDSEEMGTDSFPYYLSDGKVIFPYGWCLKRILVGPEDNVWSKFEALVLKK